MCDLYTLLNIVMMIKCRWMRCVRGMCHAWEINMYIIWLGHQRERDNLGNVYVDRQIILKLIQRTKSDTVQDASGMNTRRSQYQYYIQVNS